MCTRSSERAERWHICLRVSFFLPEFEVALLPGHVCIFLCRGQGRLIINQSSLRPSPSVWAHPHLIKDPDCPSVVLLLCWGFSVLFSFCLMLQTMSF